jgi:hypothetical protein
MIVAAGAALVAIALPLSSAFAQSKLTTPWRIWAQNGRPAIDKVDSIYNSVEAALKASNATASKADFIKFSNAAVVLASISDSPSKSLNAVIVKSGVAANTWAWDGYLYISTLKARYITDFKAETTALTKDLTAMDNYMVANGL